MPSLWDNCDPKSNIQKIQKSKIMTPTTTKKPNDPYTVHLLQKLQPQGDTPAETLADMEEYGWYWGDLIAADLTHPLIASIFDDHLAKTPRPH